MRSARRVGPPGGVVVLALASVLLGPIAAAAAARGGDPVDVVILTYERATHHAVRGRLDSSESKAASSAPGLSGLWVRGHVEPGPGRTGRYSVALGLAEESGAAPAEAVTQAALETWRPRYLLLLGTAAAASDEDVRGELIVPRLVCEVDERATGEALRRRCHRTDRTLLNAALALSSDRKNDARRAAAAPDTRRGRLDDGVAIASEAASDAAFIDRLVPLLLQTHRTVLIEREALGTARAIAGWRATHRDPVGFTILRGVSSVLPDRPAVAAPEERERTRSQATEDASRFAIDLIRSRWPVPPR